FSMSALTLLAALSVKMSGSGMALVMSFMNLSSASVGVARMGLELDYLVALLGALVDQLPHHDRSDVDLDRFVRDVSCDTRLRKEFDILRGPHGPRDRA